MKLLIREFVAILILAGGCLHAQNNFHNIHILDPYNPEYVPGELLIKFKDDVVVIPHVEKKGDKTRITTGIKSIDEFILDRNALDIEKVFGATRASQRETRYITDFKGNRIQVPKLYNIYKIRFDDKQDAIDLAALLSQDPSVEYAEPNYLVYNMEVIEGTTIVDLENSSYNYPNQPIPDSKPRSTNTIPNDPLYAQQWYLPAIDAPAAWDSTTGDTSQVIAIIDTGVDWNHPDLDDNIWTNWDEIPDNGIDDDGNGYIDDIRGWDYVNDDNDPRDDNSHGTHVAGITAAEGNNGIGICGMAWNARIMPVKMLQSSGSGNSSDLASAIEYASDNGAAVINMSLGSYGESMTVKSALENAYSASFLVAAAGNDGYKIDPPFPPYPIYAPMFPACYSFVLGVEATNSGGSRAGFSNMDPSGAILFNNLWSYNYEIKAPGVGIISCKPSGNYWQKSGTSMASPIAAATVALMKVYDPSQSHEDIFSKIIQSTNSGTINIYNCITATLVPEIYYIDNKLVDTLPGCDGDGKADAGETIELYYTVKNAGGSADSVWSLIRLGQFEDTAIVSVSDSLSFIGSLSTFATMQGTNDPFRINIGSNTTNNRSIRFAYLIYNRSTLMDSGEFTILCQKGREFSGYSPGTTVLKPDELNLITNNTVFDTIIINPGTTVALSPGKSIFINSKITATGKPDSLILFTVNGTGYWGEIKRVGGDHITMKYCRIEYGGSGTGNTLNGADTIENCMFSNNYTVLTYQDCYFIRNVIHQNCEPGNYQFLLFGNQGITKYNIVTNNITKNNTYILGSLSPQNGYHNLAKYNVVFDNEQIKNGLSYYYDFGIANDNSWGVFNLEPNFFGSNDSAYIENHVLDFFEGSNHPIIMGYTNHLSSPPTQCHGVVWDVKINNKSINKFDNPYNATTGLGVIGAENIKFDVLFNQIMDTAYHPFLSFGVREPYTQNVVIDSSLWSSDSLTWSAYFNVGLETGDGIQRVRISNARDIEYFEIPIEDSRFEFVIQAAGAQSINFIATPGIGKVELEWPPANTPDVLGYNLYKFYNLTDSTYSDTSMINSELILDTLYTDFYVIPDTTYHYLYTIIGTDMAESDYSKRVIATPFDAANGDANGDLSVNVLDITTIVSYMLNQNPTPFLFDAADVNSDGEINVLDIIGLFDIISGKKTAPLSTFVDVSDVPAYYEITEGKLVLQSDGNVAGLQFIIEDKRQKDKDRSFATNLQAVTCHLQQLKIFSLQNGFEFAYAPVGDEIIGILYSLTQNEIPKGDIELLRFEGLDVNDIEIINIFGGDANGDYVPIYKLGEDAGMNVPDGFDLKIQPNPVKELAVVSWQLAKDARVNISIYDIKGRKITTLMNNTQTAGIYQINWLTGNPQPATCNLEPGIYICHLEAIPIDGSNNVKMNVKVIIMK